MTDKQTPSENSEKELTKKTVEATTKATERKAQPSTRSKSQPKPVESRKRSKTAIVALVCSLAALAGLGGGYVWQNQQNMALMEGLVAQNQAQLNATEQQLQQLIRQQQTETISNVEQFTQSSLLPINEELAQLNAITDSLQQSDPTDWLVHEAEYLIRIATRAMWLEKDARVAIELLTDADLRIKELNDPEYLPVRQLINQDIESLKLLPELATDDVILKLIALSDQVGELPIAMAHLPESTQAEENFELSENTADWQENLGKTWRKFMEDFITVKRRTANVEALLTPSQQQNLRHNLQLKLQLSQWSASQHKERLYDASLAEVQAWLEEYFDMDDERVQNFHQAIQQLKSAIINLTLPEKLDSLSAIRGMIKNEQQKNKPSEITPAAQPTTMATDAKNIQDKQVTPEVTPAEATKAEDNAEEDDSGAII